MTRKRRAFPGVEPPRRLPKRDERINADDQTRGVFGFFRDFGTRETIESIVIAIVLALLFKGFEAEAFIIPTGSMAPSLQGEHLDLECDQCSHRYRVGSSHDGWKPLTTVCPICQYETQLLKSEPDHQVNSGDRILVNKFIYDFVEPKRYDVIVFKYPYNGKANYIKRLIALPGDNVLIENGDIYLMHSDGKGGWTREISRKPSKKVKHVLIEVDDTDFIGERLSGGKVTWPSRWNQYRGGKNWEVVQSTDSPRFVASPAAEEAWLRYRNIGPISDKGTWNQINSGNLPQSFDKPTEDLPAGRLITDRMAYNAGKFRVTRPGDRRGEGVEIERNNLGFHWVGDIGVEAWLDVKSDSGELSVDVVEGGAHFTCQFDVGTGKGKLVCDHSDVTFVDEEGKVIAEPTFDSGIEGTGSHQILMVNADDQIHLWIDGRLVEFDGMYYKRTKMPIPTYDPEGDSGDAEPIGIGAKNLELIVSRLKVVRDLYYSSEKSNGSTGGSLNNETGVDPSTLRQLFNNPREWSKPVAQKIFMMKRDQQKPMFELKKGATREKDQFLPMGDNSTESSDARVWGANHYVERDMLIGRAIFVYWPHTLNKPIPFIPNFGRMTFIR
jgi:signal peptidase I